jgi:hypothetical protein
VRQVVAGQAGPSSLAAQDKPTGADAPKPRQAGMTLA